MTKCKEPWCKRGFTFSYCSKLLWEIKLSCSKCRFFWVSTKVANDETGYPPVPFDITPLSLTPTVTTRPHKQNKVPRSFHRWETSFTHPSKSNGFVLLIRCTRLDRKLVLAVLPRFRMSGWYNANASASQAHVANTWAKAKSFCTHPAGLVWTWASNPTIRCPWTSRGC